MHLTTLQVYSVGYTAIIRFYFTDKHLLSSTYILLLDRISISHKAVDDLLSLTHILSLDRISVSYKAGEAF